jgi:predicted transposase YbfD/YdcC
MEPLKSTLLDYLTQVPDPRCRRGRRYAWSFLLALVASALLAGQRTVLDMALWSQRHAAELLAELQPARPRLPSPATLRRLLQQLDVAALERQVAGYNQRLDAQEGAAARLEAANGEPLRAQAVDGKDVRGARAHGQPLFLVSLVRHGSAYVLGQAAVAQKTNEITAVPALLAGRDLSGTVTTMDALLTQRALAQQIRAQGGHYLMIVKENQPVLHEAIQLLFQQPPVPVRAGERLRYQSHEKAHGRRERRTLECSTALNGYLDWPGLAQVLRRTCRRIRLSTGEVQTQTHYAITDLGRDWAGPKLLEHLWRGHWTIENRLHYVRDETLGEDRSQSHTASAPQALAALRNGILALLRYHGWSNIAAANRHYDACPHKAWRLLTSFSP